MSESTCLQSLALVVYPTVLWSGIVHGATDPDSGSAIIESHGRFTPVGSLEDGKLLQGFYFDHSEHNRMDRVEIRLVMQRCFFSEV